MIPEYELHTFERGGYFATEIVPNKLAVISLNTLYWYIFRDIVVIIGSRAMRLLMGVTLNLNQELCSSNG